MTVAILFVSIDNNPDHPTRCLWEVVQLKIQVSQGSTATYLWLGGKLYSAFFRSSTENGSVRELLISVHVRQSYRKKTARVFFYN